MVLTVNKCESENMGLLQTVEFWSLGLGEPVAISALHGNGVAEVLESIMPHVYEVDKVNLAYIESLNVWIEELESQMKGSCCINHPTLRLKWFGFKHIVRGVPLNWMSTFLVLAIAFSFI